VALAAVVAVLVSSDTAIATPKVGSSCTKPYRLYVRPQYPYINAWAFTGDTLHALLRTARSSLGLKKGGQPLTVEWFPYNATLCKVTYKGRLEKWVSRVQRGRRTLKVDPNAPPKYGIGLFIIETRRRRSGRTALPCAHPFKKVFTAVNPVVNRWHVRGDQTHSAAYAKLASNDTTGMAFRLTWRPLKNTRMFKVTYRSPLENWTLPSKGHPLSPGRSSRRVDADINMAPKYGVGTLTLYTC
jgi:hypothetical protein